MQLKKMTDEQIRRNGIDAHALKQSIIGTVGISEYDLYYDKDDNHVYIVKKSNSSVVHYAYITIVP